jgi:Fe-S cluster assembly ATP-binding protein
MRILLKTIKISVYSKENGVILLKNIGLEIGSNEIHCLIGKNGSGKSTLAYALMGLDRYSIKSGSVFFLGKNITRLTAYERARMGMTIAFQEPARFEGLTVKDFLLAGKKNASNTELKKSLHSVGLDPAFLARKIDEKLSGGERKRIEIASVMIMRPKLLILDEPDASLDIIVYNEFYDLLLTIKKELGCSILLITHREEAGLVADKATLLDKNTTAKTGQFREVMRAYCSLMGGRKKCNRMCKISKLKIR